MKNLFTITAIIFGAVSLAAQEAELLSVQKIWDQGGHNAFTDIIRHGDRFLCVFREADGHVKGDGKIRVIGSEDGDAWSSLALLEEDGIDLRDPKISETPDGRLMIVAGGSVYRDGELVGRQPRVAFSDDGEYWTATRRILSEGEWLWRVTWHEGTGYGVSYAPRKDEPEWKLTLFSTEDGVDYETVTVLDVADRGGETTLRFLPDATMVALVRREQGDKSGWIGHSAPPYTEWSWHSSGHRFGGPDFIRLPDGSMWAGSRGYGEEAQTVLAKMTLDSYEPVLTLPSGGDTSYPGFVWHDGVLWMSYYASHEGKTNIYLAKIKVSD